MPKREMNLIKQAELFKKEADLLLEKFRILELLKQCGRIRLTGSYRLNLMLNGDIDIHVVNPKTTKESVIKILNKFIKQGFFNGYLFFNWVRFRREDFPKGYYVGLKKRFNRRKWKLDIWFLKKDDQKEGDLINLVERNLNDQNRLTILKFKHLRNIKNLDIPSEKIYRAVIKKKITGINEFLKFVKQ